MNDKVVSMKDAIGNHITDGDIVALESFTHLIPFAAGHEIIRQKKNNLTVCRLTPDVIYDQMIAAGCVKKLVFSWAGSGGVGTLRCFRRAVEKGIPNEIELEEYSHYGMVLRYFAGAANLPFMITESYRGSDFQKINPNIKTIKCPYTGKELSAVPALKPDVTIINAQRADVKGNTQIWGIVGAQTEACFAAKKVIVVVEEIVDDQIIRSDPNRTVIPEFIVDAVVKEPFGAHPSYAQGYYDRDNDYYIQWGSISKDEEKLQTYLEEFIYGVEGRDEYVEKLGGQKWIQKLKPKADAFSNPVNYGIY